MEEQTLKSNFTYISAISIVYFTTCGALWHLGYWSTFDINILQYISVTDVIKSFIFPFLSSAIVILLTYLAVNYLTIADNIGKPDKYFFSGNGMNTKIGQYLNRNKYFYLTIYLCTLGTLYFIGDDFKWVYLPLLFSIPISIIISHQPFFIKKISHPDIRFFVVTFIIVIPLMAFGLAKRESLAIRNNEKYQIVTKIESHSDSTLKQLIGYKFIGYAGNKLFLANLDNSEIVFVNDNIIEFISFQKKLK